jgi:hypothetical protein
MSGDTVEELLMGEGRVSEERSISLGQFQTHGHEFGSSVPHIGWDIYRAALYQYVMARDGKLEPEQSQIAIATWVGLIDPTNLKIL